MKIDFTKDEYRVLMEAVYLADWFVNSSKLRDEKNPEFVNLLSKVFSFAQKFGFGGFMERDDRTGEFHGNAAFEDCVEEKGYIADVVVGAHHAGDHAEHRQQPQVAFHRNTENVQLFPSGVMEICLLCPWLKTFLRLPFRSMK